MEIKVLFTSIYRRVLDTTTLIMPRLHGFILDNNQLYCMANSEDNDEKPNTYFDDWYSENKDELIKNYIENHWDDFISDCEMICENERQQR